jgi:hypothetical protein
MKVAPAELGTEKEAGAARRAAEPAKAVRQGHAADGVRAAANPFGSVLGLLLQPARPLSGIAKTAASAAALQAQALAAAAAPAEARAPDPQAAARPEGLLGRLTADAVDPDGRGGRRGGRDGRADTVDPAGEGGAAPQAAAPAPDVFVPGVAAMLGRDDRAADIVVDTVRVAESHLASEAPEETPHAPPGRDALPVGAYARVQRAVADDPTDGPVIDPAARTGARDGPSPSLSDAVLSFGMTVSEADLRIVRRGADLVISVAGAADALVLRGAAAHGAPALAFADGVRIEGAELLARARAPEAPRAAGGGLPDGGLVA